MTKITWKAGTMMSPLPPALITSGDMKKHNVMTAAWTGIICSDPVITYVSIRPSRYSHEIIKQNKEFVINLPTSSLAEAVDTAGVKTGRGIDKFELLSLTPEPSSEIKAPQIAECPVSMECKVLEIRSFGTHDMFLAEVLAVNVDKQYVDKDGALDLEKANLLAYAHGFYYTLGKKIGKFGFSVEKKKKTKPQKATILKADKKFGKEMRVRTLVENKELADGTKVVVKKPKFQTKPKEAEKPQKKTTKKNINKFAQKENKRTSYEPYSFKKKSDGSFKKKLKN